MSTLEKTFLGLGILILVLVPIVLYVPHTHAPTTRAPGSTSELTEKDWLATSSETVSFRYPGKLSTLYIHEVEWPPKVMLTSETHVCNAGETEIGRTEEKRINGKNYCVTMRSEGAAGSTYTDYTYTTQKSGKIITLTFTLRTSQCANYEEPSRSACQEERSTFNVDALIDRIVETVELQ